MKRLVFGLTIIALSTPLLAEDRPALKDTKDKVSYSIGLDIGGTFKAQKMELNTDALAAGIRDALSGAKPLMTEEEVKTTMVTFSKEMSERQGKVTQEMGVKNAADGERLLAENKKKADVKTTASGLQYKVMKEGSGTPPKETDRVKVNYRGTFIDGTEFDSSYARGESIEFGANEVIKGWTEALQLMKPGSKYQLFIPSNLAYGANGKGRIGPNSALIFEVELLEVKPGGAGAATAPAPSPAVSATASPR